MRHVKQLIYGIFYIAFWAVLIGGVYAWQKPAPTCFDGKQNGAETGVDCGGNCVRVCIPEEILPLEAAGAPRMILFGAAADVAAGSTASAPRASLIAEVRNRNQGFGASDFDYTFSVHDQSGAVIASFPGNSFIYAGEIKYLTLLNAELPASPAPSFAQIELRAPQWTPDSRFPRPMLAIRNMATEIANDNIVTRGVLVNQDKVDFQSVDLTALFYDRNGAIVGVSGTERNNVTSGESRDFALFHPIIPGAVLERTKVFATAFNPR